MEFKSTHENNWDQYLGTLKSMNYENNTPIKSSFREEKLPKYHLKMASKKPKKSANFAKTMEFKSISEYNSNHYIWIH